MAVAETATSKREMGDIWCWLQFRQIVWALIMGYMGCRLGYEFHGKLMEIRRHLLLEYSSLVVMRDIFMKSRYTPRTKTLFKVFYMKNTVGSYHPVGDKIEKFWS